METKLENYSDEFKKKCINFYLNYYKKQNTVYRHKRKNAAESRKKYYYNKNNIYHPIYNKLGEIEKRYKRGDD